MKDYRKYCRPKTIKFPLLGDVEIRLNCGNIVYVKYLEYLKVKNSFKIKSFVGEDLSSPGNMAVIDKETGKEAIFSTEDYDSIEDLFEISGIVGDKKELALEGDIVCHNSNLNIDAIFSYNDWVNLDDSWDTTGLFGIQTYDNDDELTEDRYVILSNGTTFIIKLSDYSYVLNNWEIADSITLGSIVTAIDLGLPSGTLWEDRNIGAKNIKDAGFYFAWGETYGYENSADRNAKLTETTPDTYTGGFDQTSYNRTGGASGISADLSNSNDAASVILGGSWRMPTQLEFQELYDNCDSAWVTENGVNGRRFTSKTNGNSIFFPAAGYYNETSLNYHGSYGYYWSSSWVSATTASYLNFGSGGVYPQGFINRRLGFPVRAVQ